MQKSITSMRRLSTFKIAFCCALSLTALLGGAMNAGVFAAPVDIAVDIDSRRGTGGALIIPEASIATQAGFRTWNLTDWGFTGPMLIEQGVTFSLIPWWTFSSVPQPSIGSRVRLLGNGVFDGGGGTFNDVLSDFAYTEIDMFALSNPRQPDPKEVALKLTISGLDPGRYKMTSWHYDSTVVSAENIINIGIGDESGPRQLVAENLPLGIAPAMYTFEVTSVGQVKVVDYLAIAALNPNSTVGNLARSRLNGFTLVSVPEPASLTILAATLSALAIHGRRRVSQNAGHPA